MFNHKELNTSSKT